MKKKKTVRTKGTKKGKLKKQQPIRMLIFVGFVIGFLLGIWIAAYFIPPKTITREIIRYENFPLIKSDEGRFVEMNIPAVDSNENGVIGKLRTIIRPGSGLVLVSINDVLAGEDTQQSARTAAKVAANYTGIDMNSLDIIYLIKVNASVIGGPSAGAAMTIATILTLQNKTINPNVMITGTINHDGSIGPAGSVEAKAKAAAEHNASLFLVPLGHASQVRYVEKKHCEFLKSGIEWCDIEYIPERIKISEKYKQYGMFLIEVQNIEEALEYFIA